MPDCTAPRGNMRGVISSSNSRWSIGWCHMAGCTGNCADPVRASKPKSQKGATMAEADKYAPIVKSKNGRPVIMTVDDVELFHKANPEFWAAVQRMPKGY